MVRRKLVEFFHYLQQLSGSQTPNAPTDAELLERYVQHRDPAAFELLLWRHATLVFGVCRRVLACEQDAEDAFQATFLALVRKAHVIVRGGSVAGWLYRVAYRVALEAKERSRKTQTHSAEECDSLAAPPAPDPLWNEVRAVLDEEVNRLPERLRQPFVLCYLEGKTNGEAARQLGCRPGTIFSRLARGRELLRRRLVRRGVTLTTTALIAALGHGAAEAVPAGPLLPATLRAALLFANGGPSSAGVPARVTSLAEGVLRSMFLTKLKTAALLLLLVGLLAVGGAFAQNALKKPPQREDPQVPPPALLQVADKKEPDKVVVQVVHPSPGGLKWTQDFPGQVRPAAQQQVTAVVSGYLKRQLVGLGDRVKKGDVLAEIDAPLLRLEAKQAAVGVTVAEGEVAEVEARVSTAKAEVQSARELIVQREKEIESTKVSLAFAQKKFERIQQLVKDKAIDQSVADEHQERLHVVQAQHQKAQAALAGARSDVAVQENKVRSAQAAVESARARVEIARLAAEKAEAQLGFTVLRAGFDGVVTAVNFDVGDYISARDAGVSRSLLTVQRADVVRVIVDVAQPEVKFVRPGVPVDLGVALVEGARPAGLTVSRVGFAVNATTRTMPVEIDVPNPKDVLRPGMVEVPVTLHLQTGHPDAFAVPATAIVSVEIDSVNRAAVYVVRDGKAYRTPVRLSPETRLIPIDPNRAEFMVEILSGVKATDQIVVNTTELVNAKKLSGKEVPVTVQKPKP